MSGVTHHNVRLSHQHIALLITMSVLVTNFSILLTIVPDLLTTMSFLLTIMPVSGRQVEWRTSGLVGIVDVTALFQQDFQGRYVAVSSCLVESRCPAIIGLRGALYRYNKYLILYGVIVTLYENE